LKNLGASTLEILGDTKAGVYLYTSNCGIPDDKSILTAGPSITFLEQAYVGDAVRSGWNSNHSEYISEFEKQFAEYVGANYALSTSSCTGALHLSLLALEVGPGDEVIVPDITWVATASAIMYVGATPVFADVNKSDWTINIESLKSLINSKTKAIIPVHLYGFAANMNEIIEIASKGEIFVIEDAAPAIGTELSSKRVGTSRNRRRGNAGHQ
jgi:perosamine synthetase